MAHCMQSRPRPPSAVPRSPPLGQCTPPFPSAVTRPSPGRQLRDPRPLVPRPSCDHFPLSRCWSCHCRLARSAVPLGRNVIPPLSADTRFRPRRPARVCWSEARRPVNPPQGQTCAPRPPSTLTPRDSSRSRGCVWRSSLTLLWLAKPRPRGTLPRPPSTVVTPDVRCHCRPLSAARRPPLHPRMTAYARFTPKDDGIRKDVAPEDIINNIK